MKLFIHHSQRTGNYLKELEKSVAASVILSPPRMVHASRVVVPRDLLIRTKISVYDGDNIIAPVGVDEKLIPGTNIFHYPRCRKVFENYGKKSKVNEKGLLTVEKFSFMPSATDKKELVLWHPKTLDVIDSMQKQISKSPKSEFLHDLYLS